MSDPSFNEKYFTEQRDDLIEQVTQLKAKCAEKDAEIRQKEILHQQIVSLREKLRSKQKQLKIARKFIQTQDHRATCALYRFVGNRCTCGLVEALEQIGEK